MLKRTLYLAGIVIAICGLCLANLKPAKAGDPGDGETKHYHKVMLEPGWNSVSTPRPVLSHVFSAAETSDNFDIFVMDATMPNNWATMADLGQTEFTPLYGYFINNKTGQRQSIIFNYVVSPTPEQSSFQRKFTKAGWYSFAPAHTDHDWVLRQGSGGPGSFEGSGPSGKKILQSLEGKTSSFVDFSKNIWYTYDYYKVNPPYNVVSFDDLDTNFSILTELKGYATYVTDNTAILNGEINPEGTFQANYFGISWQLPFTGFFDKAAVGDKEAKIASFKLRTDSTYELRNIKLFTSEKFPFKNLKVKIANVPYPLNYIPSHEYIGQTIAEPQPNTEYTFSDLTGDPFKLSYFGSSEMDIEVYVDVDQDAELVNDYSFITLSDAEVVEYATGDVVRMQAWYGATTMPTTLAGQNFNIVKTLVGDLYTGAANEYGVESNVIVKFDEGYMAQDLVQFFVSTSESAVFPKMLKVKLTGDDTIMSIKEVYVKVENYNSVGSYSLFPVTSTVISENGEYFASFNLENTIILDSAGLRYVIGISPVAPGTISIASISLVDYDMLGKYSKYHYTSANEIGFPTDGRPGLRLWKYSCGPFSPGDMITVDGKPGYYVFNDKMQMFTIPQRDEIYNDIVLYSWYNGWGSTPVAQTCYDQQVVPATYPVMVNFRPGTYVIKRASSDQLFVVEPHNTIAAISLEAALELYGNTFVARTVIDDFWPNFVNRGEDVVSGKAHPGMLVKVDGVVYYVDFNNIIRQVTAEGMSANRFREEYVHNLPASFLNGMTEGPIIESAEADLIDITQTLIVPQIQVSSSLSVQADSAVGDAVTETGSTNQKIASFVFKAGSEDVILSGAAFHFYGSNGFDPVSAFQNVKLIDDASGAQLGVTVAGLTSEYLTHEFSLSIPKDGSRIVSVWADVGGTNAGSFNTAVYKYKFNAGESDPGSVTYGFYFGQNVTVTVDNSGSVLIEAVSDGTTEAKTYCPSGQNEVQLGKWKITPTKENVQMNKITFLAIDSNTNNFGSLSLYEGTTLIGTAMMVNGEVLFSNLQRSLMQGSSTEFVLKGTINEAGVMTPYSKVYFSVKSDANVDLEFVGEMSGVVLPPENINTFGGDIYFAPSTHYMFVCDESCLF